MSFHSENCGRYKVNYGFHPIRGYFLRVFDREAEPPNTPILDRSEDTDGLTYHELVRLAKQYGAKKVKLNL